MNRAFALSFSMLLASSGTALADADADATGAPATDAPAPTDPAPTTTAEPAPTPTLTAAETAGYDGGFFIKSPDGKYAMKLSGRVQGRHTFEEPDGGDSETAFAIQRARLKLSGHVHSKDLKYKFQVDLGKGNVVLKDFIVDYKPAGNVYIRVGQFKRPFSRQQINSSGKLELVDRAITDKGFGSGRDIGLAVHNNYEKSPEIEWVVGVFNGTGDKPHFSGTADMTTGDVTGSFSNVPDHFGPAFVGRVGYNANGVKGYSEGDFEGGPLRYGVGASILAELDGDNDDQSSIRGELDYVVKVNNIATTGGVYVATVQNDTKWTDQTYGAMGFHLQGGYMINKKYQPVVRLAMINPDGSDNNETEVTGGLSIYGHEHKFKLQADAGTLISQQAGADSTMDLMIRTQLQLVF